TLVGIDQLGKVGNDRWRRATRTGPTWAVIIQGIARLYELRFRDFPAARDLSIVWSTMLNVDGPAGRRSGAWLCLRGTATRHPLLAEFRSRRVSPPETKDPGMRNSDHRGYWRLPHANPHSMPSPS